MIVQPPSAIGRFLQRKSLDSLLSPILWGRAGVGKLSGDV